MFRCARAVHPGRTVEGRRLDGAIGLPHGHDVNGAIQVRRHVCKPAADGHASRKCATLHAHELQSCRNASFSFKQIEQECEYITGGDMMFLTCSCSGCMS